MGNKPTIALTGKSIEEIMEGEIREARVDIREYRDRLGEITLGDFTEAIYGTVYASHYKKMVGEEVYNSRMRDVEMSTEIKNGGIKTTLTDKRFVGGSVTPEQRDAMRDALMEQDAQLEAEAVKRAEQNLKEVAAKGDDSILKKLADMTPEQREAVFALVKMGGK